MLELNWDRWNSFLEYIYKFKNILKDMKKEKISGLQIIAWVIGFIALGFLIYGVVRALIM